MSHQRIGEFTSLYARARQQNWGANTSAILSCRTSNRGLSLAHTDAVVVLTTIATNEEAVTLIRELLDRRLIACGTVLPQSRSIYRWEGKIADETEAVLLLKTRSGCVEGLRRAFSELHPYKVPELLAIPVTGGLERYLGWINSETSLTIA